MPFVDVINLEMTYNSASRVGPVSFSAEAGEFVSLLGPSGCGKTTSLRCIAGFAAPSAGDIRIDGRSVLGLPPNKRDIGLVFQNYALFPHLTVFENVAFGLRLRKEKPETVARKVHEGLEMVGLTGFAERMPAQLSGGQQQRVALARSIVLAPKLLLLDEPLSNLDAKLRVQMRALLRHLQQKLGITTIYVTHDQTEALAMSDRIVVMNAGKVCQFAPPREIYDRPADAFVADFIGNSNLIRGTVTDAGAGRLACQTAWGALPMDNAIGSFPIGTPVRALIRPESVSLIQAGAFADPNLARLPATVDELTYVGDFTHLRLALGGGESLDATLRSRGAALPGAGAAVEIGIPVDEIYFLKDEGK